MQLTEVRTELSLQDLTEGLCGFNPSLVFSLLNCSLGVHIPYLECIFLITTCGMHILYHNLWSVYSLSQPVNRSLSVRSSTKWKVCKYLKGRQNSNSLSCEVFFIFLFSFFFFCGGKTSKESCCFSPVVFLVPCSYEIRVE